MRRFAAIQARHLRDMRTTRAAAESSRPGSSAR
jgi:hypothetical protein